MSKINNKNSTIKRVLLQIRPYLPTIILLLALAVVSVLCSRRLPTGPRRLAGVLREALKADRLDPFYGVLMDQSGRVVYGDDAPMPADRILSMNWLLTSVEGRIPQFEEFTEKAQELIKLQGVERQSEP